MRVLLAPHVWGVDDDTFVALTHENGVRSHLCLSLVAATPGPRFRVLGTRATWTKHGVEVQEARLRAGGSPRDPGYGEEPSERWGVLDDGERSVVTPTVAGDYSAFYAGVERAIREGTKPPVDPADALAGLEIIEAARRG